MLFIHLIDACIYFIFSDKNKNENDKKHQKFKQKIYNRENTVSQFINKFNDKFKFIGIKQNWICVVAGKHFKKSNSRDYHSQGNHTNFRFSTWIGWMFDTNIKVDLVFEYVLMFNIQKYFNITTFWNSLEFQLLIYASIFALFLKGITLQGFPSHNKSKPQISPHADLDIR